MNAEHAKSVQMCQTFYLYCSNFWCAARYEQDVDVRDEQVDILFNRILLALTIGRFGWVDRILASNSRE